MSTQSMTPRERSSGVVADLLMSSSPVSLRSTVMSVNVPPVSMPMMYGFRLDTEAEGGSEGLSAMFHNVISQINW